ncbi:hypothetical protein J5X84_13365 [Streptosporangiaceae bacterium NEAU-GS5]|nr:hypothetical protein [Streptosporangiaceae bacterium NEAU-GS5]
MTAPLQMSAPEIGGRRALTLALLSLVMTVVLPVAGLAMSAFGTIVAFRDTRALSRAGAGIGMAATALAISVVAFLIAGLFTTVQIYFADELNAYTECRKGASTSTAEDQCFAQFKKGFENKTGFPWPSNVPFPG